MCALRLAGALTSAKVLEDIIIDSADVKAAVRSVLREKVATRYTYQAVDQIVDPIFQTSMNHLLKGAVERAVHKIRQNETLRAEMIGD